MNDTSAFLRSLWRFLQEDDSAKATDARDDGGASSLSIRSKLAITFLFAALLPLAVVPALGLILGESMVRLKSISQKREK